MHRLALIKLFFVVMLGTIIMAAAHASLAGDRSDTPSAGEVRFAQIVINGRPLIGPNNTAQRRGGRILLPVTAIARGLGDTVNVSVASRKITVVRQTGVSSEFDAAQGRVSENGSIVLMVSNAAELVFSPNVDDLALPVELVAALFEVSIRYDDAKNTVIVARGTIRSDPQTTASSHSIAELYRVDYEYGLNRYSGFSSNSLNVNAAGRLGDGRFSFTSNSTSSGVRNIAMRNANFSLERPNGQRLLAGDFGTGSTLAFISSNVRGGSASLPFHGATVTAFGGRAFSGTTQQVLDPLFETVPVVSVRNRYSYDTSVYGIFATKDVQKSATIAAGIMRFSSAGRSGDLIAGSVNYGVSRFRLQGDVGFGNFSGFRADNTKFKGIGAAVDLSGTIQLTRQLAVQGRFAHIGQNFLSPQSGIREPVDLKAVGITWSPVSWLSTSVNVSSAKRPGDAAQDNKFITAAVSISPSVGMPRFYISHTQSSTSQIRSGAFTLFNASKDFSRFRLFLNATRIKTVGPASTNAQIGTSININDANSLEFTQGVGSRRSTNGEFDWRTSNLFPRLSFSAGVGYSRNPSTGMSTYERLSASMKLPRQTSLQVNYYQTANGPTLLVSLKGSLFRKRESQAFLDSPVREMNSYGNIAGRVYQDTNLNGHYDPGVDRPQADVKVRIDGNRYVVSDQNGQYRFDTIAAGDHKVFLDLLSVRADLSLLGGFVQETTLAPGSESTFDFRLVRTGRIAGRVWLDTNENGKFDDGETPLADIRVVTASGRDTLTDTDGNFILTDLPPGEHVILIDEKTLPEKTTAGTKPLAIQVFPGRETAEVDLRVINIPAEVKRFNSKPQ